MAYTPKVAIIYTGEVRTCEKTIENFRRTFMVNDGYHIFAVLQSNNPDHYFKLLSTVFGSGLKSFKHFDKRDRELLSRKEKSLDWMDIAWKLKDYLKYSGSITEYYQLYLAYQDIVKEEAISNMKYDYVIRMRCDTCINYPIYFDWDTFDELHIKNLLTEIKTIHKFDTIISLPVLNIFMNSIYHKDRIHNDLGIYNSITHDSIKTLLTQNNEDDFITALKDYIREGKFIITLRSNVIYFIKRKYMESIHDLGITYGIYNVRNTEHWWNSESQLVEKCLTHDIDVFDSVTPMEDRSLYLYDKDNYFYESQPIKRHDIFFFIQRS